MFSNYRLDHYTYAGERIVGQEREGVTRESVIAEAREMIDCDRNIALVEVWASWSAGNGPRLIRIYREAQWQ